MVEKFWECPHCSVTARSLTDPERPATPHHTCSGLAGLLTPMVPKGFKGRVFTTERQDYIGTEKVLLDGRGRPIMNTITERPDGSNDLTIYAPVATSIGDSHGLG